MLDGRLVGYWSDRDLYQGAMESAELAFRADGTGWTYWSRSGGPFQVMHWDTTASGQHTLGLREKLSGRWHLDGRAVRHRVDRQGPSRQRIVLAYAISPGQDLYRRPAMLLQFDRGVMMGTIGDRFARLRDLTEAELSAGHDGS